MEYRDITCISCILGKYHIHCSIIPTPKEKGEKRRLNGFHNIIIVCGMEKDKHNQNFSLSKKGRSPPTNAQYLYAQFKVLPDRVLYLYLESISLTRLMNTSTIKKKTEGFNLSFLFFCY